MAIKPSRGGLLIGVAAAVTVLLSLQALIYYTRWFVPFLYTHHSYVVPLGKAGAVWFLSKIISNCIFLVVGILLFRLYRRFRGTGYFGPESLRVLDFLVFSCVGLAAIGLFQTFYDNVNELHFEEWSSMWAIANCLTRFVTHQFGLREPQTMYILLAAVLWAVRQFVEKALAVKKENESFV